MTIGKTAPLAAMLLAGALAVGCGEPPKGGNEAGGTNANRPAGTSATNGGGDMSKGKVLKEEDGADGSHIKVRESGAGGNATVRTWATGPIAKVVKVERNGQTKAIRVLYRDGKLVRVEDKDAITHALDWTAAQIDDAAKRSGKTIEDVPARDKKAGADADDDEQ